MQGCPIPPTLQLTLSESLCICEQKEALLASYESGPRIPDKSPKKRGVLIMHSSFTVTTDHVVADYPVLRWWTHMHLVSASRWASSLQPQLQTTIVGHCTVPYRTGPQGCRARVRPSEVTPSGVTGLWSQGRSVCLTLCYRETWNVAFVGRPCCLAPSPGRTPPALPPIATLLV